LAAFALAALAALWSLWPAAALADGDSSESGSAQAAPPEAATPQAEPPEAASPEGALGRILAAGLLRVAIFDDKPPFCYLDSTGELRGFDVSLARRLAKDLLGGEDKIEFVIVQPAERVSVLLEGRADVVLANFTVTPDRAGEVDFGEPYMKASLAIASPRSAPISHVTQLRGREVIVIKGTTAESYFAKNHPEVRLQAYDHLQDGFQALRDGKAPAISHDSTLLYAWIREFTGFTVGVRTLGEVETIAPAVRKGEADLLAWLDGEILKLTAEGFFFSNYDDTLLPYYGDSLDPMTVLIFNEPKAAPPASE
jgi:polar amino acid transport system substrate-binding protein